MKQSISETEAARILGLAVQTLRNWRCQSRGPKYLKLGRAIKYDIYEIEKYMHEHTIDPEKSKHQGGTI